MNSCGHMFSFTSVEIGAELLNHKVRECLWELPSCSPEWLSRFAFPCACCLESSPALCMVSPLNFSHSADDDY